MENNVQTSKIGVRDLVNVAIFTVIYFVIFYVCAMTGFVPVMAVFYPVLTAIIAGIPCILFYTKVKSFGLVTIMGVLLGLIFFLGIAFHLFLLLPERVQMRTRRKKDSKEVSVEISQEGNQPGTETPLLRAAALHALARMKQTLAGLLIAFILLALQFLLLPATVPLILTLGLSVPGLIMAQACTEQTEDF